jgi:sulfur-oxidizing protein SoxZ
MTMGTAATSATAVNAQPGWTAQPIRIRARARNGITEVLILMPHPMETGLRKDGSGEFIPAHFITDMQVSVEGRAVLEARMSIAVSADPLLNFRFRGGQAGQAITVSWTDNRRQRRQDTATIT